jgi:hypothetical protein
MKKTFIIHPILFAIFPILFLYSHNIEQLSIVSFSEILMLLAVTISFTIIAVLLSWLILKIVFTIR